ncbi:phage tail tube protein FII [Oxobacter pfennigii]|uniref:Phage tail tube protein FII n=1 Tax=Oxobacter pfennigii TaxID=36849 RepID=A0A0P8W186_9CLOT|nr:phage major tail tube protein [Oxobacter pfennigii]KPU42159.1 phage tail tube protein FII [Oxobacter pfennigii]
MIISGTVIAHKLLTDGLEIDDNVSVQLPSIETQTGELKGAGIMGTIDMPASGQIGSLVFTVNLRSMNKNSGELMRPGIRNIELRFVRDVMTTDGSMIPEGTKIFITGINKKYDPGKVEINATMDGAADFEVLRYRQVVAGKETLLIDKRNFIFKINGRDYMQDIRSALG